MAHLKMDMKPLIRVDASTLNGPLDEEWFRGDWLTWDDDHVCPGGVEPRPLVRVTFVPVPGSRRVWEWPPRDEDA